MLIRPVMIACLVCCIAACSQESDQPSPSNDIAVPDKALPQAAAPDEAIEAPETEENAGLVAETLSTIKLDTSEGAKLAKKKCGACHYLDRNLRKVGPTLKGIYGRKPAISDLPFETWDEASLDTWLEDPKQVKPKTKMAIPGIKDASERKAIIEYLKQL